MKPFLKYRAGYQIYTTPFQNAQLLRAFRQAVAKTRFNKPYGGPIYYKGVRVYCWGDLDL